MLCFRRETDYALQLLRYLAKHKGGFHSLKTFAKEEKISFWFMQKIARKLSQACVIKAEQGIRGGYRLAMPAKKLTIYQIVNAMEDSPALVGCLEKGAKCSKGNKIICSLKVKMSSVNKQIVRILRKEKVVT